MPSSTTNDTLASNLACLGERNADLAQAIAQAPPCQDLVFQQSKQEVPTATLAGRHLASQHRPLDEGAQLVEEIDLTKHAVFVVCGFGLGYHVKALAQRLGRKGLIVVFEDDLSLLHDVLSHVDHTQWLKDTLVVFANDAQDRGQLGRLLHGADAIIGQGVTFIEHPPSRAHLGTQTLHFTSMVTQYVGTVQTTLMTTMVKSIDTTRNLLSNIACYANARSIDHLANKTKGTLGIVVSAGPSLRKNIELLANQDVRDRSVVVAVQTALKPLLDAGIRPDFVTALDYHEISRRFYEDLPTEELEDITLVIDPKVHPSVVSAYPGPITSLRSDFLEAVLQEDAPGHGTLPAGATVAHLAFLFAKLLGCNPIAMIGQDLGFTDGLYYAPGTAIHDVWAPELNYFNTIEMMEWERIARHRQHLSQIPSIDGCPLYTDGQMIAYLHQFERLFEDARREGVTVIDATEGGALKQHTMLMPLKQVLDQHAKDPRSTLANLKSTSNTIDNTPIVEKLRALHTDLLHIIETAISTQALLDKMLVDQENAEQMQLHFSQLGQLRQEIEKQQHAFGLLSHLNQLGAMQRLRADRQIALMEDGEPLQLQRAQLLRDQANVTLIRDAARTLCGFIEDTINKIENQERQCLEVAKASHDVAGDKVRDVTVAALIPITSQEDLDQSLDGKPVLQWTLERLGQSSELDKIIVICNRELTVNEVVSTDGIDIPVEIEMVATQLAIDPGTIAARLFAQWCWRGGLGGNTIYDELLHTDVMAEALKQHNLDAGVLVSFNWPLVDVSKTSGIDAVVQRFRSNPQLQPLVFTQAPPGLGTALITTDLVSQFVNRTGVGIGSLLAYRPAAPRPDPIASSANVQIDHRLRTPLIRASCDTLRGQALVEHVLSNDCDVNDPIRVATALADADADLKYDQPQHVILELTPRRVTHGSQQTVQSKEAPQADLNLALAERLLTQIDSPSDTCLTLAGRGDPLLHSELEAVVTMARETGIRGIHIRTDLLDPLGAAQRLLSTSIDVISVNLNANTKHVYLKLMGVDRYEDVLTHIEELLDGQTMVGRWPTPWVVPRMVRCAATLDQVNDFYDRWMTRCGTAVIDPAPAKNGDTEQAILTTIAPPQVRRDRARREMTILCDGSALKLHPETGDAYCVGSIMTDSLTWLNQPNLANAASKQGVW